MALNLYNMKLATVRPDFAAYARNAERSERPHRDGLFRTVLTGRAYTVADVFANEELTPKIKRTSCHAQHDLLSARVCLRFDKAEGCWKFTRICDEIYVVVINFLYKKRCVKFVSGDDLIQFGVKISEDMTLDVGCVEPLRWNRPSMLVWAQPHGISFSEWTAANTHERSITSSVRHEFLTEQLSTSSLEPSSVQVARSVGMAESTLTKAFASVHGQQFFDFSRHCRMQRAMTLISDQRWSVAKASEKVGYSHPTSFATAFQCHFGLRPVDVRCNEAGIPCNLACERSI